jgi:hypothetical protein
MLLRRYPGSGPADVFYLVEAHDGGRSRGPSTVSFGPHPTSDRIRGRIPTPDSYNESKSPLPKAVLSHLRRSRTNRRAPDKSKRAGEQI